MYILNSSLSIFPHFLHYCSHPSGKTDNVTVMLGCVEYLITVLYVTKHLIQILLPVGVIAGSVIAVLLFGVLVFLVVFILLKRPDIIRLVQTQ